MKRKEFENIHGLYVVRVNKMKARNAFNRGNTIFCTPVNFSLYSIWFKPFELNKYDETLDFDTLVNQIEFYNCNNESGTYLKYYIIAESERQV